MKYSDDDDDDIDTNQSCKLLTFWKEVKILFQLYYMLVFKYNQIMCIFISAEFDVIGNKYFVGNKSSKYT